MKKMITPKGTQGPYAEDFGGVIGIYDKGELVAAYDGFLTGGLTGDKYMRVFIKDEKGRWEKTEAGPTKNESIYMLFSDEYDFSYKLGKNFAEQLKAERMNAPESEIKKYREQENQIMNEHEQQMEQFNNSYKTQNFRDFMDTNKTQPHLLETFITEETKNARKELVNRVCNILEGKEQFDAGTYPLFDGIPYNPATSTPFSEKEQAILLFQYKKDQNFRPPQFLTKEEIIRSGGNLNPSAHPYKLEHSVFMKPVKKNGIDRLISTRTFYNAADVNIPIPHPQSTQYTNEQKTGFLEPAIARIREKMSGDMTYLTWNPSKMTKNELYARAIQKLCENREFKKFPQPIRSFHEQTLLYPSISQLKENGLMKAREDTEIEMGRAAFRIETATYVLRQEFGLMLIDGEPNQPFNKNENDWTKQFNKLADYYRKNPETLSIDLKEAGILAQEVKEKDIFLVREREPKKEHQWWQERMIPDKPGYILKDYNEDSKENKIRDMEPLIENHGLNNDIKKAHDKAIETLISQINSIRLENGTMTIPAPLMKQICETRKNLRLESNPTKFSYYSSENPPLSQLSEKDTVKAFYNRFSLLAPQNNEEMINRYLNGRGAEPRIDLVKAMYKDVSEKAKAQAIEKNTKQRQLESLSLSRKRSLEKGISLNTQKEKKITQKRSKDVGLER